MTSQGSTPTVVVELEKHPTLPICDHRHLSAAEVSGQATFQVPNRGVSEDELE
jgi:hypothetical protein